MADSEEPSTPAAPPPPQTLGQMLRAARLAQDLTLEQLSTDLRIETRQLNALEEEHFEQIGVPVFVKGYLKQYGTRLGLDVRDLLALYYKQTTLADVQIKPNRTIRLRDDRQITSWILAVIVLLTVVVALAVWWWNGASFGVQQTSGSSAPPTAEPPAAEPAPAPQSRVIAEPAPAVAPPVVETPPASAAQTSAATPAGPPPVAAGAAAVDVARADVDVDDRRAAQVVAIPLEFTFDQESSAEVTDARGERLLSGSNAAGRRVTVRGEPPFAIVIGNADAVRLAVDGEPYSIPTVGREGSLARFSVDVAEE